MPGCHHGGHPPPNANQRRHVCHARRKKGEMRREGEGEGEEDEGKVHVWKEREAISAR